MRRAVFCSPQGRRGLSRVSGKTVSGILIVYFYNAKFVAYQRTR